MVEDLHFRPLKLKQTKACAPMGLIWTCCARSFPAKISRIKTYSWNAASSQHILCLAAVVKKGTFTDMTRLFWLICNSSNKYMKYFTSFFFAIYSNYSVILRMYTNFFSYVNIPFASQLQPNSCAVLCKEDNIFNHRVPCFHCIEQVLFNGTAIVTLYSFINVSVMKIL